MKLVTSPLDFLFKKSEVRRSSFRTLCEKVLEPSTQVFYLCNRRDLQFVIGRDIGSETK